MTVSSISRTSASVLRFCRNTSAQRNRGTLRTYGVTGVIQRSGYSPLDRSHLHGCYDCTVDGADLPWSLPIRTCTGASKACRACYVQGVVSPCRSTLAEGKGFVRTRSDCTGNSRGGYDSRYLDIGYQPNDCPDITIQLLRHPIAIHSCSDEKGYTSKQALPRQPMPSLSQAV